jgi:hypothetical protein
MQLESTRKAEDIGAARVEITEAERERKEMLAEGGFSYAPPERAVGARS